MADVTQFLNIGRPLRVTQFVATGIDAGQGLPNPLVVNPGADGFVYFQLGVSNFDSYTVNIGGRVVFSGSNVSIFFGSAGSNQVLANNGQPFFPCGKGEILTITRNAGSGFNPVNYMLLEEDT